MNNAWRRKFGPVVAQIMLNAGPKMTDPARRATVLEVATKAVAATKSKNAKASMKKAKNAMVKREENLLVLRSMDPKLVIPRLERGANAKLLTARNTTSAFKGFERLAHQSVPRVETMEAIARMLTMLLRHGAPFSSHDFDIEYYIDASVKAHVDHGKGRIAFLNLIRALAERGFANTYHIITAHTIFGDAYRAARTPETWNRVLEIIDKLIPPPQNTGARRAHMQHILTESLEYMEDGMRPYEVEGLLRLAGRLTPQMLHVYISGADVVTDNEGRVNVSLDGAILDMFWRSGVRVPRSVGNPHGDSTFWSLVRKKLARHSLYNDAQPKPKPNTRSSKRARSPTSNNARSNAANRNRSNASTSKRRRV